MILLTIMLPGIAIVEYQHIAFAQANATQNTIGKLNIENESASSQSDLK